MNRTQIKIENAGFGYFGPKKEQVFENVDFCVNAGQILCLLGPNGTGKSTILKCLNNILKIHTGRITVNGENISRLAPSDIAVNLGYVPQSLSSAFPLPVRDIVVMGRATHISIFSSPS
ncbi:MAG: ABC transporter ATP-binding protein, partial [Desulfobacterales bacterium]|nr:ABC transporter ATP-binding protein [Desulfobacterales bacterium]